MNVPPIERVFDEIVFGLITKKQSTRTTLQTEARSSRKMQRIGHKTCSQSTVEHRVPSPDPTVLNSKLDQYPDEAWGWERVFDASAYLEVILILSLTHKKSFRCLSCCLLQIACKLFHCKDNTELNFVLIFMSMSICCEQHD